MQWLFSGSKTISSRVDDGNVRTTGFDYLRIILALSVVLWHSIVTSYGYDVQRIYQRLPLGMAYDLVLPMFFGLSGYLVAGSMNRCRTLVSFFSLRVLRIVPALGVEIAISALIFGPLLTSYSLSSYFSHPELPIYFLNIVGHIQYLLPGLFEGNPFPRIVNGQLWTIPSELNCYLVLGGLAAAGLMRNRWLLLALTVAGQIFWIMQAVRLAASPGASGSGGSGQVLVLAFLCGVLLHLFRERVRLHWGIFLACAVAAGALAYLPYGKLCLAFPAAYMTIYLGLLNPPGNRLLSSGDYSYGLFLYGFPIQQAVASVGPATQNCWVNIALALPATSLVAVLSWHYLEKPALGLRRHIPVVEAWLVRVVLGRDVAAGPSPEPRLWIMGIGSKAAVLAGVALLLNGNDLPGTLAITAAFVGLAWSSRMSRPIVQEPLPA